MYEQYIQDINNASFLANRMPTGVYEWDEMQGFGQMIHVGDIVEIPVERKLETSPYNFQRVLTRGVVYLRHGEFRIDINNDFSATLCRPHGTERIERTVMAGWPRTLSAYSYDRRRFPNPRPGNSGRYIRILGNIAENPELLVR